LKPLGDFIPSGLFQPIRPESFCLFFTEFEHHVLPCKRLFYSIPAMNIEVKNENEHEEIDSCVLAAFHRPPVRWICVCRAPLLPPHRYKLTLANGGSRHKYQRSNSQRYAEGLEQYRAVNRNQGCHTSCPRPVANHRC